MGDAHTNLDEELKAAAAELSLAVDDFTSKHDNASRQDIVKAAERVLASARDARTQWMDDALETSRLAAMHLFQVWGGFGQIPDNGAVSFVELARKLDAETSLVGRLILSFCRETSLLLVCRAHRWRPHLAGDSAGRRNRQRRPHPKISHPVPR